MADGEAELTFRREIYICLQDWVVCQNVHWAADETLSAWQTIQGENVCLAQQKWMIMSLKGQEEPVHASALFGLEGKNIVAFWNNFNGLEKSKSEAH